MGLLTPDGLKELLGEDAYNELQNQPEPQYSYIEEYGKVIQNAVESGLINPLNLAVGLSGSEEKVAAFSSKTEMSLLKKTPPEELHNITDHMSDVSQAEFLTILMGDPNNNADLQTFMNFSYGAADDNAVPSVQALSEESPRPGGNDLIFAPTPD